VIDSALADSKWSLNDLPENGRAEALKVLNKEVVACRICTDIACRRTQTVFGIGPLRPKLVMFGEAPGAEEDRAGQPFVGPAGQLLDRILVASGLARDQVYIMNTLKCRPPNNRTPTDIEIENCRPFFERQLDILQPEYIVCWGAVAARAILKTSDSIGRLRGRFHTYKQAKVMITYHPAYLLRTPEAKRLTWEDMKMLMRELGIPIPNTGKQA
jgi:DNA polymerase